jgi:tetratricopeptide (TPR) repeat protein
MTNFAVGFFCVFVALAQNTPERAIALNNLGNQAADQADYAGAARYFRESIAIWRSLGADFEPHLASGLTNLGTALCGGGRRIEGAAAYEEALALNRRTLGLHNIRTVSNINLLAVDYLLLDDVEKGDALLTEVMPIVRADFAGQIPLARTLEGAANVFTRRSRPVEAIALADEALSISLHFGERNLDTALAYASAAEVHRAAGQPERALPLYRKAYALYVELLGPNHPRIGSLLSQQGLVLMADGKLSLAEDMMQRAVDTLQRGCPDCAIELAMAENNLGLLRLRQKRYRDADAALTRSLALRESISTRETPELAETLRSLAFARKMLHRDDDAAQLNVRANMILGFK